MGGEDFSAYQQVVPGCFFIVGAGGDGACAAPPPAVHDRRGALPVAASTCSCARRSTSAAVSRRRRPAGRAARRLRRDRRDGGAARAGARGAVPGAGVRGDPPPARRVGRRPALAVDRTRAGRRSSSTRSSSRSCARRCARSAAARGSTTATCSAIRSTRSRRSRAGGADDAGRAAAARRALLQAHGGDRVRGQVRRRRRAQGLDDADIVLVGVSRTSKTPLSIYLGYLGYKTANVPIVKGIEPPPELFEIDAGEDRRADDRRGAARRDPRSERDPLDARRPQLRRAAWRSTTSSSTPRAIHRRLGCPVIEVSRALDRGDRAADHPARRAAARRGAHGTRVKPKPPVPRGAGRRGTRRSRPPSSSSTASSRRSGSRCARSPGSRSSARACAAALRRDRGQGARRPTAMAVARSVRLRLRRALATGGRELLGGKGVGLAEMTQLGLPRARRVHDHDRRLPRLHGRRASCRTGSRRRSPSTCAALEEKTGKRFGDPTTTRCSSRCARARRSRCRG